MLRKDWKSILSLPFLLLFICAGQAWASSPTITSLSPTTGAVGASVTISGTNFGTSQGTSTVKFNGTTATATSWSATSIAVTVPSGATTGNVVVTVSSVASNGKSFTVVSAPSITSLSITTGAVGAAVTITGTSFGSSQGSGTVSFNGTTASVTSWNSTTIKVTVPSGATTGNVVVFASGVNGNGSSFTVVTAPSITSLSITTGAVGAAVTITGTNFGSTQGSGTVTFNGTTATVTSWSATSIVVTVPSGATTGSVVVFASGVNSNAKTFTVTPVLTSLSITTGAVGAAVTITGTGFGPTQGTGTVKFNGTAATVTSWSVTSIAVTVPTGATTGNVVVNTGVNSNGSAFTVVSAPSITSLSITTGAFGAAVTITGTNFGSTQGLGTVSFNGTTATVSSWSATSIGVTVPSGALTGNVIVFADGVNSNGSNFTVLNSTITSLSPTSGVVGTAVTITGTNFGSTQGSVSFNGTAANVTSWSATSIGVTVPSGATTGSVVVDISGVNSNGVTFTVMSTLPSGWADTDVGTVGVAGGSGYASNVFTVAGAGVGVTNTTSDGFHFVYQTLSGNGTIIARVVSTSSVYAQAGVMVRETLNATATSMVVMSYTDNIFSVYRTTTGANSATVEGPGAGPLPYWVELVRSGSSFSGYQSPDGVNWVQVGTTQTINMAQNVYIGLAVSSGSTTNTYTETFDNVSVSTTASPAPAITGVSATTGSVGSQVVISGTGFGASQGSSVVLLNGSAVTINSWSSTSITITIPTGATSGDLVVSVAPSMDDSNPVVFTVTSNPLPTGWLDQDIGQVGVLGSASYASGVFTVQGAGSTIGTIAEDGLHFAYQLLSGDGTIIARVVSTSSAYAQAGVMIRETLDAGSNQMFVAAYSNNVFGDYRTTPGAYNTYNYDPAGTGPPPYWVELVRTGSSFAGYASPDGISWTLVAGPLPIDMAQNVYIGLGVSSGSTTIAYTATFDNVSISTPTNSVPVITSLSATTGTAGSQVVVSGSGFGASQGSSVVLLNDMSVTVNSWSATSISITIPTGASSGLLSVLVGPGMVSSNAVFFTITSQPLLSGWLDQDVGIVGLAGSASYTNSGFTVQGAGTSIAGTADGFHFVYQQLTTDGAIVAQVVSQSAFSQAGVVIRETLSADSAEVFSYLTSNYQNATSYMSYRTFAGGLVQQVGGQSVTEPYWVEAVRTANMFSCYVSQDGQNWVQVGATQTLSTSQAVYVGLGVSSGSITTLATATFDNVAITQGTSLPNPVVTGLSPTSGAPGTVVTVSGSGFGATQGASYLYFNGVAGTVSSWSDSQIIAAVPDGASTGPVSVIESSITGQGPVFSLAFTAQLTNSLGNQTSYSSSVAGGQWGFTTAQGSGCSTCTTRGNVQNQYDANGNLLWRIDALGNTVLFGYDSSGDLTTQFAPLSSSAGATTSYTYNSFGEALTVTDPLGNVTTNSYDAHGNLLSVTTPAPGGSGGAASVTQFTYNTLGELTQVTDPLGHITTMTYTSAGLIATITDPQSNVTSYQYDSRGNRTSVTDALQNQTTFAYDSGSRLLSITYPGGSTSSFTYDYRGRRITATDQNGKTTTYAYDGADRLTSVTDAASNTTQYAYDTENNLLSITDASSHTTNFSYDAFGRVTQTTFPSNYFETYAYDANNNLTSKTDRKGQTIQYVYDALNRLTQKTYPDSTSVEYTYDLVGKVLSVNDPTGNYTFAYDNMGRLIGTTTQYSFLSSPTFTNAYTFDAASNRTGYTAPDSSTNTYSYDTLNRLTSLANSWAGSFGFSYDALSRRTQMTRPNGVTTNYSFNNMSRLLSVLHQQGGSTIDGATYTVDAAGNRTAKADALAGVTSNYTYDPLYELTQVTQTTNTTESYSYDPVGNRLSSAGVSAYTNNSSNELTSTSAASYAYDANGNTTSKTVSGNTTQYTWDFENRLSQITLPNSGGTVTFKYDPLGKRIYKQSPNATSIFAYDGANLVETVNATGGEVAHYVQGVNVDEPLAMQRGTTTDYYEVDGLGSVSSLSSSAGGLANTYTYDSFGNTTNSTGSVTNFLRYTAREFDTETNLYFYRARYYDSSIGRFLSEDPIRFRGGPDFYRYAKNSPIDLIDPRGLAPNSSDGGGRTNPCRDAYNACMKRAKCAFSACTDEAMEDYSACVADCYEACPGSEDPLSPTGHQCFRSCTGKCVAQLGSSSGSCSASLTSLSNSCGWHLILCDIVAGGILGGKGAENR